MRVAGGIWEYKKTAGFVTGLPDLKRELAERGDENLEQIIGLLHYVEENFLSIL